MPNWCQNQLTVTGATPEFRAWLEKEGFSFEKMNPPRKSRKSTCSNRPILDSHCNAWGTTDNSKRASYMAKDVLVMKHGKKILEDGDRKKSQTGAEKIAGSGDV